MESSTIRSAVDPTLDLRSSRIAAKSLREVIYSEWRHDDHADLVTALRRHPVLLHDRSLLLNLAIEEYHTACEKPGGIDLEEHCQRFEEFGSSVQRCITRQLETQRYFDEHPELIDALCTPDWPGNDDQIGNFRVLEELGRGASARVFLCAERDIGDRWVVVKATPHPSFEACILGRLDHPNIIPILSTGFIQERGLHYVCMPFCGRSTLNDVLDVAFQDGYPTSDSCLLEAVRRWGIGENNKKPGVQPRIATLFGQRSYVDAVLRIAIQIADALNHAHSEEILHGDLKPSNVLLTSAARPLLLDFNLSQDFITSRIAYGGTLPYMPPEHLRTIADHKSRSQTHTFDPRSDIYSFGALLFELLSGKPPINVPHKSTDPAVVAKHLLHQIEGRSQELPLLKPAASGRIESLLMRCLSFNPSQRPSTMLEVLDILKADVRPISLLCRRARARPFVFSLSTVLSLSVIAAAGGYVATRPPQYLTNYEQGIDAGSKGQLDKAAEHFLSAVRSKPSFKPARFELARTRLALGDLNSALNEFAQLAVDDKDSKSMAYVGYCFNLKATSSAAIPWYERAIRHGATSVEVLNNLGASNIDGRSKDSRGQQLQLAEDYLFKALKQSNGALVERLNLVRLAVARMAFDKQYDPSTMWPHAKRLLEVEPDRAALRSYVAQWYRLATLRSRELKDASSLSRFAQADPEGLRLFENVVNAVGTADPGIPDRPQSKGPEHISLFDCYLEPISLLKSE